MIPYFFLSFHIQRRQVYRADKLLRNAAFIYSITRSKKNSDCDGYVYTKLKKEAKMKINLAKCQVDFFLVYTKRTKKDSLNFKEK